MISLLFLNGCDRMEILNSLFGPKKNQSFLEFCLEPTKQHKKLIEKVLWSTNAEAHLKQPFQYNKDSCEELLAYVKTKPSIDFTIQIGVPDISFIKEFTHLEKTELIIREVNLDFSPLKEFVNLKDLTLITVMKDLKFLEDFPNLEKLTLSAQNQTVLNKLTILKLKHFYLYSGQITDISFLSNSPDLETIRISDNNIEDLSPISELYNLKSIGISSNEITDICPVQNLINLESVAFKWNRISKMCSLKKLKNLKWLNLNYNKINRLDALQGLDNLEYLFIVENNLTDITPLQDLKKLKNIDIPFNQIVDLTPISRLTGVTNLIVNDNLIKDISALKNMRNLESFHFGDNQVEDVSVLRALPSLKNASFQGNPIKDYTPVLKFVRQEDLQGECTEADVQQGYCTEQQYRLRLAKKRLEIESLTEYFKNNAN